MKPPENKEVRKEIRHVIKTVFPILLFTTTVILATLGIVSFINDIPFKTMVNSFWDTVVLVLKFF